MSEMSQFPIWKQSEWLSVVSMRSKNFPLKVFFPIILSLKLFLLEIIKLITPIFFCDLYCAVRPLPFLFMGGLPVRIWVQWSIQDGDNVRDTVLKFGAGRPPGSGSELHFKPCEGWWEGRMLIKIINNCWKEKWITTVLSDQPGELPGLTETLLSHKPCRGDHEICCCENFLDT